MKYHPDKNPNDKERCEKIFKQVQEANNLIGTSEDRRNYDQMASSPFRNIHTNSGYYGSRSSMEEEILQRFFRQQQSPYGSFSDRARYKPRRAFYVNGVDVSQLFDMANSRASGINPFSRNSTPEQYEEQNRPRSIFVTKITIPLEELYAGVGRKQFKQKSNFFSRYIAAFRGGLAAQIGLNSFLTSLPLLFRVSWLVSLIACLVTFSISLPSPPMQDVFFSKIKPGWKEGTKLTFKSVEPGTDVVFVIREGKHDKFERDGNDLKTCVKIGTKQASRGCTISIDPLGQNEDKIQLKIASGEITSKRQCMKTIKGQGWPNSTGRGDLHVYIKVVSQKRIDRTNKKKRRKQKQ